MSDPRTGTQFRAKWTYPYLENRGEFRYGKPGYSKEEALANLDGSGTDEGWYWAGKLLGYERREVLFTATEWTGADDE